MDKWLHPMACDEFNYSSMSYNQIIARVWVSNYIPKFNMGVIIHQTHVNPYL